MPPGGFVLAITAWDSSHWPRGAHARGALVSVTADATRETPTQTVPIDSVGLKLLVITMTSVVRRNRSWETAICRRGPTGFP